MKEYLNLIRTIHSKGILKSNRTKIKSLSIFGYQIRLNLMDGFPLLTTKKCNFRSIVYELLWMVSGSTNIKFLQKNGISIWNHWADKNGNLGPLYGKQWRSWESKRGYIDQLKQVIIDLKKNPNSRRIILSSWNVGELSEMALAPCHILAQFYVSNRILSCHVYQRSCDVFLGLPFNIASYSLLVHMLSQQCDLKIGDFIWTGGDIHIYENHFEQINLQLKRTPYPLPKLNIIRCPNSLFNYTFEDFRIENYNFHPAITADIAV